MGLKAQPDDLDNVVHSDGIDGDGGNEHATPDVHTNVWVGGDESVGFEFAASRSRIRGRS